jgi:hypothetical protein
MASPGQGDAAWDIARILVEAVQRRRIDPATASPPTHQLIAAADYHGVVLQLKRAYGPDSERAQLGTLIATARRLRSLALRIAHHAVLVSGWLHEADIPHAVIKGPAMAAAYPNADREFVDLDLLVAPEDMRRAITELERHGATVLEDEGWPRNDGIGELALGLPSGVAVDLHADLVHHADVRRQFRFPAEPLLARATTVTVLGHELPTLDPEDSCAYIALHAVISGGHRLVWLADLDALVRQQRIDWATLVARARQARLALVVGVMLARTATVLGTPVPADALAELLQGGRLWNRLLAGFERYRPTSESYGSIVRGQVLVRATRRGTASSLAGLARLIWTDVICFAVTNRNHPWRVRLRGQRRGLRLRWR